MVGRTKKEHEVFSEALHQSSQPCTTLLKQKMRVSDDKKLFVSHYGSEFGHVVRGEDRGIRIRFRATCA